MTVRVSTKFKELILGPHAFESIFYDGRILVYAGGQPPTADDAAGGVLLAQITTNGAPWVAGGSAGGLRFAQSGPYVTMAANQLWDMIVTETGTAGWWRLVGKDADDGSLSYSAPRVDGSIGLSGTADMIVASTALTAGTGVAVQQFLYTIPPIIG